MSYRKRPRGTGSVCQIKGRWYAYGAQRTVDGKRSKPYLGVFESKRAAERHLERTVRT